MGHVPKPEGCGESYQSCMDGMLRVTWKYAWFGAEQSGPFLMAAIWAMSRSKRSLCGLFSLMALG